MPLPIEESRPEALWNVLLSRFVWLLPCGGVYVVFSFIPCPSYKLDIMSKGSVYSITHTGLKFSVSDAMYLMLHHYRFT